MIAMRMTKREKGLVDAVSPELQALRRQVENALGKTVAQSDAEDSDLEDDEVMFAQDDKLAAAFRALQRPNKRQREERQRQLLQLKMRCLDMFDVLLNSCTRRAVLLAATNTLLQTLTSRELEVVNRAAKLLRLLKQKKILEAVKGTVADGAGDDGHAFVDKLFSVTSKLALSQNSLMAALSCLQFAVSCCCE